MSEDHKRQTRLLTFQAGCDEVDRLAAAEGCDKPYTLQTGRDCWRQQYDDDMTPSEVWADEKSYAADDRDECAQ